MKLNKITALFISLTLLLSLCSCLPIEDGLSAYEIAVKNGFTGSESEWLDSLKGKDGENGADGKDGEKGDPGIQGSQGIQGVTGVQGIPGLPGLNGIDGIGVKDAYVNDDLHLIVVLSDGSEIDAGYVGTDREEGSGKPQFASELEVIRPGELHILDGLQKGYVWKSSDARVARVTADGLILGVAEGECVITATSYTGESASCTIRVVDLSYKMNTSGGITVTSYNGIGKSLVIPEKIGVHTVTEIDTYAFFMHPSLEEVTLPDTLKIIGDGAFSNCEKLKSIHLGGSVEYIGSAALSETALTEVILPDSLTELGSSVFYGTPLESISIPHGVKTIRAFCFSECRKLKSVDFGKVERIDNYAFDTCKSLTEIVLPETLLSIGDSAFGSCTELSSVTFLNPDTVYAETAFEGTKFVPEEKPSGEIDGEGFTRVNVTMYAVEASNVRPEPSFDVDPTHWLKKEQKVQVIGVREDGWAKISLEGRTLYVRFLQLSEKKAEQLYQDAKNFIDKSGDLTLGLSGSDTGSNVGVSQDTAELIGNGIRSESPSIKIVTSGSTTVIIDGIAYVASTNGEKTKSTVNASELSSLLFASGNYITHAYSDFTEYTLDVEYNGQTLTFSGISKELFVSYIDQIDGISDKQAFSDSITEYSYTLVLHFNAEGELFKMTETHTYTANGVTRTISLSMTVSDSAESITLPEDADSYTPTTE